MNFNQIDPNLFNTAPAPASFRCRRAQPRRTNGAYGAYLTVSNAASSYYDALVDLQRRAFKGLNLQVNYTWSKNIDTGSEATSSGTGDINAAVSETRAWRASAV